MRDLATILLPFQRFFLPGLFVLLAWAIWRTVFRKDMAVGLALYLSLVVIVDGFLNTGIYIPGLQNGSIRYSEICAALLLMRRPTVGFDSPLRRTVILLAALYFILIFVSIFRCDATAEAVADFRRLILPQIIGFFIANRALRSTEAYRRFFLSLTALVAILGLFSFWDVFFDRWLLKSEVLDQPMYSHNRELGRFGSLFLNPNYLGGFVVLVFPSLLVWTLSERKPWARRWGWLGLLLLVFSLVETQSRGPMLAFGIALLPLLLGPCGTGMSRKRRMGFLALFLMLFTLFMPGFYQRAFERFIGLRTETTVETVSRKTIWLHTIHIIADHPLAGIGLGEQQYATVTRSYGVNALDNPHNSYLQIAIYAGIPALLAFLFATGLLLFRAARSSMAGVSGEATPITWGFVVGISGFLVSIASEPTLFTPTVAPVYWVFSGLLLSLIHGRGSITVHEGRLRLQTEGAYIINESGELSHG